MFLYFDVAVLQTMRKKLYSDLYFHPFFFVNLTAETINLDDIMNGNGKSVAMMSLFRRGFMLVALLAVGISVFGQTLTQQGVTCRYNGAKPHTPLGNVYIKVGSAGNAVKSDSLTGKFALTLSGLRMGMRIGRPVVVKKGMMVFNQQAVDEWSVRMEPLCVVLCDADFFQRQKNTLIEHGKRIARQKCDKRINWLEQQLKDNRLREEEYIVKLDSVQRELEMAQQQMDGCADVLARIDLSEVDTLSQRAIDLFYKGDFDAALRLFESGDYRRKLSDAIRLERDAEALCQKADTVVQLARGDQKRYAESLRAQLASYKMNNEWDKALELQKYLADTLCTLRAVYECADFFQQQNFYAESETYINRYMTMLEPLVRADSVLYAYDLYVGLRLMSGLYSSIGRLNDGMALSEKALSVAQSLADTDPKVYEPTLADAQMSLACNYVTLKKMNEAEYYNKLALAIIERLYNDDPVKYEGQMITIKLGLATMYSAMGRYSECERYSKEAKDLCQRLVERGNTEYESMLVAIRQTLASLYFLNNRLAECETEFEDCLSVRERLAAKNPYAYDADLASNQFLLGTIYSRNKRYADAERMFNLASVIIDKLVKMNPAVYESDKANLMLRKGQLYDKMHKDTECEQNFKGALAIYERLAAEYPQVYGESMLQCQTSLEDLYERMQRYDDAELMYRLSVTRLESLSKACPQLFDKSLQMAHLRLGMFCLIHSKAEESVESFRTAISLREQSAEHDEEYENDVVMLKTYLVEAYKAMDKYDMAASLNKEILKYMKSHCDDDAERHDYYVEQLACHAQIMNMLGRFSEAESAAREVLQLNPDFGLAQMHLSVALLMKGKYGEAEQVGMKTGKEMNVMFISYLDRLARQGVIPAKRRDDVEMLKKKLEERK